MSLQSSTLPTVLKIYVVVNLIFLFIILIVNWKTFLFLPLFYIPIAISYYYWKKHYRDVDFEVIANIYVFSNTIGMIIVMIVQLILAIIIGIICFGSEKFFELVEQIQNFTSYKDMKNLQVDKNIGFYVFLFLLAFFIAPVVEEILKYKIVDRVKRKVSVNYQIYAIAASLGFSTMENLLYQLSTGQNSNSTIFDLFCDAILRVSIATPFHCLYGYLTGLRINRRDIFKQPLSVWNIIKWSIFFHGNSNFWIMMIAMHDLGSLSIWLYTLDVIFTAVTVCIVVKRERKIQTFVSNKVN